MTHRYVCAALISKASRLVPLFLATFPLVVSAVLSILPTIQPQDPVPSPKLEPPEVVRIQVEALRKNSPLNKGIELTYRFASPGNKRNTGPLDRFTEMVRSAPYDRLLNHLNARYGPVDVSGNEARQAVVITDKEGEVVTYVWVLSRQSEGTFKECWMTDAVFLSQRPAQRKFAQRTTLLDTAFTPPGAKQMTD